MDCGAVAQLLVHLTDYDASGSGSVPSYSWGFCQVTGQPDDLRRLQAEEEGAGHPVLLDVSAPGDTWHCTLTVSLSLSNINFPCIARSLLLQ